MEELFQNGEIQAMVERNNISSKEKMQETNINLDPFEKICQIRKMSDKLKLELNRIYKLIARTKEEEKYASDKKTENLVKLERLKEELDEIDVEKLFVELSIGDEERELREIKAEREAIAIYFETKIDKVKNEIKKISEKLERNKGIEAEFMMINCDITALKNELEFIKSTELSFQLEKSKRELASLKEEGFEIMAQIDETRDENVKIAEKYEEIVELEKEMNKKLQKLNSDLHSAMAELESISMADKRSKSIATNLSVALNQFQINTGESKRERDITYGEIQAIKEEIVQTNMNKKSKEERFEESLKELEKAKESEALAINKLSKITEYTMKEREILSAYNSTITLSKFEYQYLLKSANLAQEMANKKVDASNAWTEALKASEREEISLKKKLEKHKQKHEMNERNALQKEEEISPEREVKFGCDNPFMAGKSNFVRSVLKSLRRKGRKNREVTLV